MCWYHPSTVLCHAAINAGHDYSSPLPSIIMLLFPITLTLFLLLPSHVPLERIYNNLRHKNLLTVSNQHPNRQNRRKGRETPFNFTKTEAKGNYKSYLLNRIQQHRDLNKRPRQIIRSIPHSRYQWNPQTRRLRRAAEANRNHLLPRHFSNRNSTL